MRGANRRVSERSRSLRRPLTSAESVLWARIRGRQLGGFKFVRQEPIDRYFVDFVCRERRLVVEIDGGQHSKSRGDVERDKTLSALGYRVLRVWNNDVLENPDGVLQTLLSECEKMPPVLHPSPLPARGEREGPAPEAREGEGRQRRADTVRAFYEGHPYPAPLADLDRHRELYRNPDRRRALSLLKWPRRKTRADRAILVAGCGTSQAALAALREPAARVTAIDISEAGLAHTRALQQKYGLQNLELHRLAIEEVDELEQTFDDIVCTGVLHHLADPDLGLVSLRRVLAADGAMQVMVYAAYGRAGIYMMQEYCRLLEVSPEAGELEDLGRTVGALAADHPIAAVARRAKDFTYPAALADALLHPCDRAYRVPEIYAWLDRCGFAFGRWVEQAPYLPQCGAIAKMPHAARLAALSPPAQHAAVELLRGTMTRHSFIAYRDDFPAPTQPIDFAGDGLWQWVPLRLPWTLAVRDRAPPGFAAVLINRAHTYPDLALPITAAEERILAKIDGRRRIDEIAQGAALGAEAVRAFVEKLWRYDQIVFDLCGGTSR